MNRRDFLAAVGATTAIAGCTGSEENSTPQDSETSEPTPSSSNSPTVQDTPTPTETETTTPTESEETPEADTETPEPDPAEFEITDLSVAPSQVAPGESVTVTATVRNIGGTEGTEQIQFDIQGATIDEQNVGDSTFEEVTESETVSKQVTVSPEESTTVSISVSRELTGSFDVSVADFSATFEVVREWNEIGKAYEGAGGLTVTLEKIEVTEKTGSYEYAIEYTLENETDGGIDEGGFQLYPADPNNDPLQQYGGFEELFPGDTVSRSYTFEEEKSIEFDTLAYHPDQFFRQKPPDDALVWPVEY